MYIILTLTILVVIYYCMPNNYVLLDVPNIASKEFKSIIIQPDNYYVFEYDKYKHNTIQFDNNDLRLYFANSFITQTIMYPNNKVIKLKNNTNLYIYNTSDKELVVKYVIY